MYIVSSCLLGENCKYSGGNNKNEEVIAFCKEHSYIPVCPEEAGDLPTPRLPSERVGTKVMNKEGSDLTVSFNRGAEISLRLALDEATKRGELLEGAILKSKSPSCGFGQIYDGTFTGRLIFGNGVFAELVNKNGIEVKTERDFEKEKT